MPYAKSINGVLIPDTRKQIIKLKKDAKRWKIIAIVLFFVGIGVDQLISMVF
jgi:hypothetical protein